MAEDSVWFSAAIGRRKNADKRWLLPMLCRRGSIKKEDIGAIRILDTTTEFEISARVAGRFAARIRRPDKEDSIRIEAMNNAPSREEVREPAPPKLHGKNAERSDGAGFDKAARSATKKPHRKGQAHAARPEHERKQTHDRGASAKPAFDKKKKKKFRG
jgi:ATP-dependent RNA helicase DeaD